MNSNPTAAQQVWLTPAAHQRLENELAELHAEHDPATRAERTERIRQIQSLLNHAVVGEDPPDDGVAEPGMVLTIRYDDGDTETFLLGVREVEHDSELEVYSPGSPLGTALLGARRGEQCSFRTPNGRTVAVTLLDAVPYGRHQRQ